MLGNAFQINIPKSDIVLPTGKPGLVLHLKSNASAANGGRWGATTGGNTSYTYAGSMWVRAVSGTAAVSIDVNDVGNTSYTVTEKWQRITSVGNNSSNAYRFLDLFISAADTEVYVWGIQFEENILSFS